MKNYVGISRDHSLSMQHITGAAMKDYNEQIDSLKHNSSKYSVDTIVSVMACSTRANGTGTGNRFEVQNSSINAVRPLTSYKADGNCTMLFDSCMELIKSFEAVPDYNNPNVSFVLMILTDGADNASAHTGEMLGRKIKELQMTDRWTITFRVPLGYKDRLTSWGIPAGNILEVDYFNQKSVETASVQTKAATETFYALRASGAKSTTSFYADTSTTSFYADTSTLDTKVVRKQLANISKKIRVVKVSKAAEGMQIRDFVEATTGEKYKMGQAFYQLTKREDVQPNKQVVVWDKLSGEYYGGVEARGLLKLPDNDTIKVQPGDTPQFEVFIQSTSVNRKLQAGTKVVIYK